MKREQLAGPDEIRQWAYNHHWTDKYGRKVADVGRLPSKLVRDFEKATGKHYMVAYEPRADEPEPEDDNDVVEIVAVLRVPRRYLHT